MKKVNKIFVFEGVDGAGKTTVINNVHQELKRKNIVHVMYKFHYPETMEEIIENNEIFHALANASIANNEPLLIDRLTPISEYVYRQANNEPIREAHNDKSKFPYNLVLFLTPPFINHVPTKPTKNQERADYALKHKENIRHGYNELNRLIVEGNPPSFIPEGIRYWTTTMGGLATPKFDGIADSIVYRALKEQNEAIVNKVLGEWHEKYN